MAQNLPRGTPGRVLVLLGLLTGLVAVSAWRDALRRGTDTWVRHPTALGDSAPLLPDQLPVRLQAGGKDFLLTAAGGTFHRRDDRMFRVTTGTEAGLPFTLFTTGATLNAGDVPRLYARRAPHEFVRLRTRPWTPAAPLPSPAPPPPEPAEPTIPKVIPRGPEEPDSPADPPGKGTL